MASVLPSVAVLALCAILAPLVSAGERCYAYSDLSNKHHDSQPCFSRHCCGSCFLRYCCENELMRLSEDKQEKCGPQSLITYSSPLPMGIGITFVIIVMLIFICCCVCPCCCLYKMCRKPRPVVATTTHTTVVTTAPQQYPQQTALPSQPQSYQGAQYTPYHSAPVQPGYGAQPMPTLPYHGQPFTPGPPPTYQEAIGPAYPPNPVPYSQAAYTPGHPAYPPQPPVQPPVQPQPCAPPAQTDYFAQPAYNPDYVTPKTG